MMVRSRRHPGLDGQVGVGHQVPHLAVHRHHVAGLDDVVAVEQLAGTGVAGHVHQGVALVDDVGAEPAETVDHPVDRVLVARDQRAGQHHGVAGLQLDDRVLPVGHPGQRGQRLALGAGGDDHHVLRAVVLDVPQLDQGVVRHVQVAEVAGHAHVAQHRSTDVDDLAAVGHCGVQDLLDPVHVRGEAGHDHPLLAGVEDAFQRRGDVALRGGEAGHLGVGRVDQEQVDPLLAEPGERPQVGDPAVQGQLVHLEVAGVQQRAGRRPYGHGQRIGDGVVDGDELEVEGADGEPLAVGDHALLDVADPVLADLLVQQGEGQLGADQRDVARCRSR